MENEQNIKISDKSKRRYLIEIISSYLKMCKSIMEYLHAVASTRKAKLVCNKSIKNCDNALVHISTIKHIEILEYLYSIFAGNNIIAYSLSGQVVLAKDLTYYDSEDGFADFQEMIKEQREKALNKEKEQQEKMRVIKEAQEQGKKVEMVWDKDTKTAKPMIIDDKNNA